MTTGVLPGIRKIREALDFDTVPGSGQNGYSLVYQHSTQSFVLANISGGGGGTSDHAGLINLQYADAGHIGFAGTGVSNTFSQNQTFSASISVGNDIAVTDDLTVGDDLTVSGLATIAESVSVPTITSASNVDITINPGGTGALLLDDSTAFRSATFDATFPIGGFRIGPTDLAGQFGLTIGNIQADTLRVVTFVADETRVDRGNQYWTKSYGILAAPFTTPAVSGTAAIIFEDSPAFSGAIASANDWVLFRTVDAVSGLVVKQAWGQLSGYATNGDGTQDWTFTMRSGDTAVEFIDGTTAVIFGATGAAYIHLSVVDPTGAPYIKGRKWVTNPYTAGNHTTYWQLGNLTSTGNPNYTPSGNGIYIRSGASAGQFIVADDNGFQIRGADFEMYNGSSQTVDIDSSNGSFKLGTNVASGTTTGFQFAGNTGNITIGGASYSPTVTIYGVVNIKAGSAGIANLTDANLDNIANGSTYFRTTANQVTGAGRAFTAIDSSNRLVTAVIPATAVTPSGAGLYLSSTHLGYYSGSAWKTYMDSSGNFLFAGSSASNYIQWAAASNKLSGVGSSIEQWYASAADGRLYAGAGNVWLAANGLNFVVQTFGSPDYIRFERSGTAKATIGFQRATGGGVDTTDGMIFNNIDGTKFRFVGGTAMYLEDGANLNVEGAVSANNGLVAIGAQIQHPVAVYNATLEAQGTTHHTYINYQTNEHTYIRGGKAGSYVILNDSSGLGNVGVGTGTPSRKLHVHGDYVRVSTATFTTGMDMGFDGTAAYLWNYQNTPLVFGVNNATAVTIAASGNVTFAAKIGTAGVAPTYYSDTLSPAGTQSILRAGQSGVSNGLTITTDGTTFAYAMLNGNVAVGATVGNPDWKFNVLSGTGQLSFNPDFSGVNYLSSYISASAGPLALYGSRVFVDGDTFGIKTAKTPATAGATGVQGQIAWDSSYLYICTATNTWRRVAHATW